jgi:hypothetical protein
MGLYERLTGIDLADTAQKIHVHQFMAALGELDRGKVTRQQVVDGFGLTTGEGTELDTLTAKIRTPLEGYPLSGRITLTNVGTAYDTNSDSLSMPFVYLQGAGVTRVDLEMRVRKVGTGTQDWQVWDETNAVEAIGPGSLTSGSLSDAGGAADRTLQASRVFASALAPGVRKLRLRAKSSVATDDPIFLNAALLVFRVDTITSGVLHEVLLLAEDRLAPLTTIAALTARLGV